MKLETKIRVHYECTLRLTEHEMRALDALAGYGTKAFVDIFYRHMGKSYLEPHVGGITTLFEKIRSDGYRQLGLVDEARKVLADHGSKKP